MTTQAKDYPKLKTARDGYLLLINVAAGIGKTTAEPPRGAKTKAAEVLGTSRQVIDRWATHGIPTARGWPQRIEKKTGLKPFEVWPHLSAQ